MNTTPGRQHYRATFDCPECSREFCAVTKKITPKPSGLWARCGSCSSIIWSESLSATKDMGLMQ